MTAWWSALSWSHAALVIIVVLLILGATSLRLATRRQHRRELLPDPWSGGIVRHQKYFTPHWNAAVGRAYRAWAAERRGA